MTLNTKFPTHSPTLIQEELDRRLAAARSSDPTKQREQSLRKELTRIGKSLERLLTAYLEELLSLEQSDDLSPHDLIEEILPHQAGIGAYRTAQFSPAVRANAFVVVDLSR